MKQHSRGDDDFYDPLPKGSFFAHVHWKHRTINKRTNEISYHNYGDGDLYFYKPKTQIGGMNFVLNMMMGKQTFVLAQLTAT